MARAKNTSRALARRKHRAARTAELADSTELNDSEAPDQPPPPSPRPGLPRFTMPNVLEDLKALPRMFLTRKLLWVPVLMLLTAFALQLLIGNRLIEDPQIASIAGIIVQLVLPPQALFTFFIGGFLAPRAPYLVGFLLGLLDAVLILLTFVFVPRAANATDPASLAMEGIVAMPVLNATLGSTPIRAQITPEAIVQLIITAVVIGTLAATFAAWYRNFLRGTQERARQARIERETRERAKKREEERQARRDAHRPSGKGRA